MSRNERHSARRSRLFQNTRFELAEMKTELDLAWVFIDRQIQALNEGDLTAEDAAEAKWWCTEMQLRTITRCLNSSVGTDS